mgnify:CR=1 FL=1
MVSAAEAFDRSSARFEFVRELGFTTPMGRVIAARTIDAGTVLLAGLRHRGDLLEARDTLLECGAERVFVDGAYGRTVAGDGRVVRGVVLSTGAALAVDVADIVERTRAAAEQLAMPSPHRESVEELGSRAIEQRRVLARIDGERVVLSEKSAIVDSDWSASQRFSQTDVVAFGGALTDGVVEELLRRAGPEGTIVVASPASIQTSPQHWRRLRESGWSLRAVHPVELLAVSVNPTGLQGRRLQGASLVDEIRRALPDTLVFDPLD